MGTRKTYDLAVKVGEYTDNQGNKKNKYENIGAIMEKEDGGKFLMIKRTFNPAGVPDFSGKGGESILISMFEPKDGSQGGGQSQHQQAKTNGYHPQSSGGGAADDDIPFAQHPWSYAT